MLAYLPEEKRWAWILPMVDKDTHKGMTHANLGINPSAHAWKIKITMFRLNYQAIIWHSYNISTFYYTFKARWWQYDWGTKHKCHLTIETAGAFSSCPGDSTVK